MYPFEENNRLLISLIEEWTGRLSALPEDVISLRRNGQNRTIRQIVGHMADSASNNTHRIIHLQYQPSPLVFPDYSTGGNNDRWIGIQDYQSEDWCDLVRLWESANRHVVHVIRSVNPDKLGNEWITGTGEYVTLRAMIEDYPRHFQLHLAEIEALTAGE